MLRILLRWGTLKRHISIGDFVVYIDIGSPVPKIQSKSRGLADENKKLLPEWKWFRSNHIEYMYIVQ